MLFLNGAFVLILTNLETRNFGVAAAPFGFMLSKDACNDRCLSRHGYFGVAEQNPLPVSLGRVRFKKCFCNVTKEFKKFVTEAVGPWTARMYPYFQRIGLGKWARNRMLQKNSEIKFYRRDEMNEVEEEEESGETHAGQNTERKQHETQSYRVQPPAPPTSPAGGVSAKRQQGVDVNALQTAGTQPLSLEAHLQRERMSFEKRRASHGLPPPPRSASSGGSDKSLNLAVGSEISAGSSSRVSKSQHSKSRIRKE